MTDPNAGQRRERVLSACPRQTGASVKEHSKPPSDVAVNRLYLGQVRDRQYEQWCEEENRDAPSPEQYDDARRRVMELRTKARMMREALRLERAAKREAETQTKTLAVLSHGHSGTPGSSGDGAGTWWTRKGRSGALHWRARRNASEAKDSLTMVQRMREAGDENFTNVDERWPIPPELRPEALPGLLLVPNWRSMEEFSGIWRASHVLFYTMYGRSTHRFAMDFARMLLPTEISNRACAGVSASKIEVVFAVAYALVEHEALPKSTAQDRVDGVQALSLKCSGAFWNRQLFRDQACAFRSVLLVMQFLFGPLGTASCIEGFKRQSATTRGLRLFESNEARAVFGVGGDEGSLMSTTALWRRWDDHLRRALLSQMLDEVEVRGLLRAVATWGNISV